MNVKTEQLPVTKTELLLLPQLKLNIKMFQLPVEKAVFSTHSPLSLVSEATALQTNLVSLAAEKTAQRAEQRMAQESKQPQQQPKTEKSTFRFLPGGIRAPKVKGYLKGKKSAFVPEIRRRGQWLGLGKFPSPEAASIRGQRAALGTLAASVRVRKAGTSEFVNIKANPLVFRPSRREEKVIIQLAPKRLASYGERTEILSTRGKGGIKFFK